MRPKITGPQFWVVDPPAQAMARWGIYTFGIFLTHEVSGVACERQSCDVGFSSSTGSLQCQRLIMSRAKPILRKTGRPRKGAGFLCNQFLDGCQDL